MEVLEAIKKKDWETAETILANNPDDIDINVVHDNATILGEACERGRSRIVELLLARTDINVNITTRPFVSNWDLKNVDFTPLMLAVHNARRSIYWNGVKKTIKLLLQDPRVEVNKKDERGFTPFLWAMGYSDLPTMRLFLVHSPTLIVGSLEECKSVVGQMNMTRSQSMYDARDLVAEFHADPEACKEKAKKALEEEDED